MINDPKALTPGHEDGGWALSLLPATTEGSSGLKESLWLLDYFMNVSVNLFFIHFTACIRPLSSWDLHPNSVRREGRYFKVSCTGHPHITFISKTPVWRSLVTWQGFRVKHLPEANTQHSMCTVWPSSKPTKATEAWHGWMSHSLYGAAHWCTASCYQSPLRIEMFYVNHYAKYVVYRWMGTYYHLASHQQSLSLLPWHGPREIEVWHLSKDVMLRLAISPCHFILPYNKELERCSSDDCNIYREHSTSNKMSQDYVKTWISCWEYLMEKLEFLS